MLFRSDFETTTEKYSCTLGYTPTAKKQCIACKSKHKICTACIKCINCFNPSCGKSMHVPNYCVSQSVCDSCKAEPITVDSKCKQCGSRCRECEQWDAKKKCFKNHPCPNTCGFRERIFQTGDAFCEFLFTEAHANFTTIAHNMKGFDGYFLLEYCIRKGLKVSKIIYAGSKIMAMHVGDSLNIRVIDSLNFLPMKLAALPKAFGLKELKKGYFPHFFNLPENQNYSGVYPEPHYYGVDFMSSKDREQFLIWFESMQGQTFNFRNEMEAYCRSDVDILRQACLCFRNLLMEATESDAIEDGIDPFKCLTIASVCMKVFKTLFLEEQGTVELLVDGDKHRVPCKVKGGVWQVEQNTWMSEDKLPRNTSIGKTSFIFESSPFATISHKSKDQFSRISIQCLKYVEHIENIQIQHALNGGEKHIFIEGKAYRIDGFCHATLTCYEYHGCLFHGCMTCYASNRDTFKTPYTKQSLNELYTITMKKKSLLEKAGYTYVCMWDHEFQTLVNDERVAAIVKTFDVSDRLNVRDSFFGGRTNASTLYHKCKSSEKIKYVDFTRDRKSVV